MRQVSHVEESSFQGNDSSFARFPSDKRWRAPQISSPKTQYVNILLHEGGGYSLGSWVREVTRLSPDCLGKLCHLR